MKKKVLIIIAIVLASFMYIVPIALIFIGVIFNKPLEFTEENNKIIINKYNTELNILNEYYDEEKGCYILETLIEKKGNKKYSLIDSLEFTYTMKDKNGYVLGDAFLYLDDFNSNNKWKKNISYCDDYARDVAQIKIKEIVSY